MSAPATKHPSYNNPLWFCDETGCELHSGHAGNHVANGCSWYYVTVPLHERIRATLPTRAQVFAVLALSIAWGAGKDFAYRDWGWCLLGLLLTGAFALAASIEVRR